MKAPHLTQWLTRSPELVWSHRLKASDKEVLHGTQRDSLVQDFLMLPTQSMVREVCLSSEQEAMQVLLQQPSGPSGQDSSHWGREICHLQSLPDDQLRSFHFLAASWAELVRFAHWLCHSFPRIWHGITFLRAHGSFLHSCIHRVRTDSEEQKVCQNEFPPHLQGGQQLTCVPRSDHKHWIQLVQVLWCQNSFQFPHPCPTHTTPYSLL